MSRPVSMKPYFMAAAIFAATPAIAQNQCGPRQIVVERLAAKWGETRQMSGLTSGESPSPMEIWANLETGTWTATVTSPNGTICIVASGTAFELRDEPLKQGAAL